MNFGAFSAGFLEGFFENLENFKSAPFELGMVAIERLDEYEQMIKSFLGGFFDRIFGKVISFVSYGRLKYFSWISAGKFFEFFFSKSAPFELRPCGIERLDDCEQLWSKKYIELEKKSLSLGPQLL